MNKYGIRIIALILACLIAMTACGSEEQPEEIAINGNAVFSALLANVTFDTELEDSGEFAAAFFSDLPENAQVRLFSGSAYYADCLAMITVAQRDDRSAAVRSLYAYVDQITEHFRNYHPDQVQKCGNAVIWNEDVYAILCITNDVETAESVLSKAEEYTEEYPTEQKQPTGSESTEAPTQLPETMPATTQAEEIPTQPQLNDNGFPALTSQSGELNDYGESHYRVDDRAFMPYSYREESTGNYANVLNSAAPQFGSDINIYCMLIPTAIGIVLPDDIRQNMSDYEDQSVRIDQLYEKLDSSIQPVNIYNNLMQHRNEYLYFRTDFHWTGTAAYYAYEKFCEVKDVAPYNLEMRKQSVFENFTGSLYHDDQVTPDVVYAYHPYYESAISMVFTDRDGEEQTWEVIKDVSSWPDTAKYNTFAGGDQPITVYQNSEVSEGVALVIKESFGNALIPYLVDHYQTVYEIDYRYWEGNIAEFAKENGVNDVIFANNMGMVSTATLVAMLADNF